MSFDFAAHKAYCAALDEVLEARGLPPATTAELVRETARARFPRGPDHGAARIDYTRRAKAAYRLVFEDGGKVDTRGERRRVADWLRAHNLARIVRDDFDHD